MLYFTLNTNMKLIYIFLIPVGILSIYLFGWIAFSMMVVRNPLSEESNDYFKLPFFKQIYYSRNGNWFALAFHRIEELSNFEKIHHIEGNILACDSVIVIDGDVLPFRFSNDFRWSNPYLINNGKVFFYRLNRGIAELKNVDSKTFMRIGASFLSQDFQHVYYKSILLDGASPKTFVVIDKGGVLGWDDKEIFYFMSSQTNQDDKEVFKIRHQNDVHIVDDSIVRDSRYFYFFDYKNVQIRKQEYQDKNTIKTTADGITFDQQFIPRSEYQDISN